MRVIVIILAAIVLIGGLTYGGFMLFAPKPAPVETPTTNNPFDGLQGAPLDVTGTDGQTYAVPDFRDSSPADTFGGDTYYKLTDNEDAQGDEAMFDIEYSSDSSVSIFLLKEPIAVARRAAEQELRKFFPLKDAELCALNVEVGVPIDINETYAGQNLGLSFCPNSVSLPQ